MTTLEKIVQDVLRTANNACRYLNESDLDKVQRQTLEAAADACLDMADRYDHDIEGCDADAWLQYGEGLECSFRLAYIIKHGTFPPEGEAWRTELVERMKELRRLRTLAGERSK